MATFVFVAGGWHGGWCWKKVASRLRALGHEVYTPSLTGLAERSHLFSDDIDLELHIADVSNLLRWEDLHDVNLVGHSYGGVVITGVGLATPLGIGTDAAWNALLEGRSAIKPITNDPAYQSGLSTLVWLPSSLTRRSHQAR